MRIQLQSIAFIVNFGLVFVHPYNENRYQFWKLPSAKYNSNNEGSFIKTLQTGVQESQYTFNAMKDELRRAQFTNIQKRSVGKLVRKRDTNNDSSRQDDHTMNEEHNFQNQNPGNKGMNEEGQTRERKPKYGYLHEYLGNVSQIPNRLPPDLGKYRSGDVASFFENAAKRPSDFQGKSAGHFRGDVELENSYTKRKNILTESEEANARLLTSRDHLYESGEDSTDARNMSPKQETYHTSATHKYDPQRRQQYLDSFNDWSLTVGSSDMEDFNFNETIPHLSEDDLLKMLSKLGQLKLDIAQERVRCKRHFPAQYAMLKEQEDRLDEGYDIVRQELENRD